MNVFLGIGVLALCYLAFAFVRLGFHQRLPLLFRRWSSINQVLEEAERRHGESIIIELESPLSWRMPQLPQSPQLLHPQSQPERARSTQAGGDEANDGRLWSAASALRCVRRLAGMFDDLLTEQCERIAIYKENEFDLYLFGTAALRSSAIAVPINGNMDSTIALGYLGYVGASVLVTDSVRFERLRASGAWPQSLRNIVIVDGDVEPLVDATPARRPTIRSLAGLLAAAAPQTQARAERCKPGLEDPHFIVHTSGTTGIPKGVLLTGVGLLHSLRAVAVFNLISRRDLVYLALPMNHQIVQLYLQAIFLLGVRTVINREFDGKRVLGTLAERRVSVFFGFPIAYVQLLEAGLERAELARMRVWGTTADASHEVFQRPAVRQGRFFRDLGIPVDGSLFVDGLGSSEVGVAALMRIVTPWTTHFGRRVGRRAPMGPRIKITDEFGCKVPAGQAGRLMIKGHCMLAGYWNAHDKLFAATRDGWWFTGDIVRRERDGELVHLDREVDVIASRRGPVYTLLLEEHLHRHSAVMDVCVFGVPDLNDADGAQLPAAVIALRSSHKAYPRERLERELNAELPPEQQLAFVQVVPWSEFPMGVTGKTLKRRLRETVGRQDEQAARAVATETIAVTQ
jgi:long-chain acyl-CoA synthetase